MKVTVCIYIHNFSQRFLLWLVSEFNDRYTITYEGDVTNKLNLICDAKELINVLVYAANDLKIGKLHIISNTFGNDIIITSKF